LCKQLKSAAAEACAGIALNLLADYSPYNNNFDIFLVFRFFGRFVQVEEAFFISKPRAGKMTENAAPIRRGKFACRIGQWKQLQSINGVIYPERCNFFLQWLCAI